MLRTYITPHIPHKITLKKFNQTKKINKSSNQYIFLNFWKNIHEKEKVKEDIFVA